ncbi:hypothetical protein [Krasilnikovia cinnamomea]|uniref:hypothetical protein n=1 Tax=Krasilnikovia cinnamomea TaxID=349313 RepID=UPI00102CF644|nr:hypothetical protein [Krasilnikovia cinnamomea]
MLLEGPAIEPLLAQVREEYGSGVRIISADKVRSGGFGGFFAKQHYELAVEVPDPEDRPSADPFRRAATATAEEPRGLEQLLERAESRDRITQGGASGGLADDEAAPGPGMAGSGAAFAQLMAGLDKTEAVQASARQAQERPQAQTVRPFRPSEASGSPVNNGGLRGTATGAGARSGGLGSAASGLGSAASGMGTAASGMGTAASGMGRAASGMGTAAPGMGGPALGMGVPSAENPAAVRPLPPVPSLAELMGGLGMTDEENVRFERHTPTSSTLAPTRSAAAAYGMNQTSTEIATFSATSTELRPAQSDPVVMNLLSVGMPEQLAAQITGGDTYAGVLSVLAARPSAPGIPEAPGDILVLAGEVAHAIGIGKQLLREIDLDANHLLYAGPSAAGTGMHSSRVMHTPAQAAARAEKLQSADNAWVVVLDAPVGDTDPIWVNDMCDALGATAVWAVVDATRKTPDSARHLRTLGDVEALVVHNVEITTDPATVLGLDVPIYSLDGRPATPHAWAAMLCARIASDIVPMAATPRRAARGR